MSQFWDLELDKQTDEQTAPKSNENSTSAYIQ